MANNSHQSVRTWQAVFFDFDGVILDSVDVKTKAFAKMFERNGPDIQCKVVQYHLENGGVSRFEKLRYYYNYFLNIPIDEKEIQKLSKEFSDLVVQKVIDSGFIEGAFETLEMLYQSSIPAFVVSGTPHDEINIITEKKRISKYFLEVHGSPRRKLEITKDIIDRRRYNPLRCLFIGDSMLDYTAAKKMRMHFLGIVPKEKASPFPEETRISSKVSI